MSIYTSRLLASDDLMCKYNELNAKGNALIAKFQYSEAIEFYEQSLPIAEAYFQERDRCIRPSFCYFMLIGTCKSLGTCYLQSFTMPGYKKSLEFYTKGKNLCRDFLKKKKLIKDPKDHATALEHSSAFDIRIANHAT